MLCANALSFYLEALLTRAACYSYLLIPRVFMGRTGYRFRGDSFPSLRLFRTPPNPALRLLHIQAAPPPSVQIGLARVDGARKLLSAREWLVCEASWERVVLTGRALFENCVN